MFGILLDRHSILPLKRQLYESLRQRIVSGQITGGEALPSTRSLAAALKLSRSTVNEAYDMLIAEGYLASRQGAPTRVVPGLVLPHPAATPSSEPTEALPSASLSFQTGRPDLNAFPYRVWRRMLLEAADTLPTTSLGYDSPDGFSPLRHEIAAWLFRSRGMAVTEDDVFITTGTTFALHLLGTLIGGEGSRFIVEDPCNRGMLASFQYGGGELLTVPVDEQGLNTSLLPEDAEISAIYVSPSHQFPLGGILPAARRAALVRYARAKKAYIVEDDYDSEFRYTGDPVAPLWSLDPQRVVHMGTFSKTLFPALRLGYVLLPQALRARWRNLRKQTDIQSPALSQAAVAHFLQSRRMDRHLTAMRRLYGHRRATLLASLSEFFGDRITVSGDAAGLHVAVRFPGMKFDSQFEAFCEQRGLRVATVDAHCIRKGQFEDMLLLGYGHLQDDDIRRGVELLAAILKAIGTP
jgi:GntR family transcriptional regulator/MocR family aminotransferase